MLLLLTCTNSGFSRISAMSSHLKLSSILQMIMIYSTTYNLEFLMLQLPLKMPSSRFWWRWEKMRWINIYLRKNLVNNFIYFTKWMNERTKSIFIAINLYLDLLLRFAVQMWLFFIRTHAAILWIYLLSVKDFYTQ